MARNSKHSPWLGVIANIQYIIFVFLSPLLDVYGKNTLM